MKNTVTITLETLRNFAQKMNIRHFNEGDEIMFIAADKEVTYRFEQHHKRDCGCFGYDALTVRRFEHSVDTLYDCIGSDNAILTGKDMLCQYGMQNLFVLTNDAGMAKSNDQQ